MRDTTPSSFDTVGFLFTLKCTAAVACLFVVAHYGPVFAAQVALSSDLTDSEMIETELEEVKAKRTLRSLEERQLLEKLEEYEQTLATRTIGTASIETLSAAHDRLIAADLSAMKLYLFENGHATATLDILSKGKRGSRWETPTGLYKVQTKEFEHFSSIGEVFMPFSMQFFGNFFIHGWPYYPDGSPVPEGYSGGCIRLSTEDAAIAFEFAKGGMPIFVWEGETDDGTSVSIGAKPVPKISAKAFLVADIRTGRVYAERNADLVLPIASLTKLITALVANETIHYDRILSVSKDDRAQTEGTPGTISVGDSFTISDLLFPLLMESNNSVAYTLARYFGSNTFVGWMADKAKAIGMEHTNFEDPSGISEKNVATANDIFKLTRYIHDNQSYILNISRDTEKTIRSEEGRSYKLNNFNVFSGNPQFLGGKTGYTDEARETMTTVFEVPLEHATATVAIVVLRSEDRKKDVEKLLSWFKATAIVSTSTISKAY
jgi:D-alanyl-D-alanine endopeptidase (penicillin-binding protein 7)